MRSSFLVLAAAVSCFAVGCGADAQSSAKDQVASEGANLVFEDTFADGGTFRLVETQGRLAFSIQAPIGSEAARLAQQASGLESEDLSQIYGVLHPDRHEVPAALAALATRFTAERSAAPLHTTPAAAADAAPAPVTDKDINAFNAACCHDYNVGNHALYSIESCKYAVNAHSISTPGIVWSKDRSFGWNETQYVATHSLSASTWQPTIPAYTYYWTEWGGTYSNAIATLSLPSGAYGPIGITAHWYHYK